MQVRSNLSFLSFLVITLFLIVLVGCSGEDSSASTDASSEDAASENSDKAGVDKQNSDYPIVIEHAFGETVIEEKPERVASIQWANHDVALALGVVPVGFSEANYGVPDESGLLPWTAEKLEELNVENPNVFQDTDGLDFEAISDTNPDVILAAYSGITQEDYDILTQIAPVVAYQDGPWLTTWRDQVMLNATGMGMKEEGEELIQDTENLIKEKVKQYPQLKGKTVAWVNFSAKDMSQLHIYTPADPRGAFLEELGMTYPESVIEQIQDPNSFSMGLSAENADILNDADILISYGDDSLYQAVKEDPLLGKISAIQRGSVVFIGNGTPLAASVNPNPLSIKYTTDEYLKLLGEAADKVNE
ncbi:iron-siderophore ABC transporter substrate-binding protein [Alteribacillus iranensis]|uniref:Iron complex transport system substrate-binding protein n=1 Tax=Alteribacillus iranensis TaxID=930128 RepID=A0A1I2F391_9BACI|nr:iron-siderophore ABC transporter substrate-binding protein [Alteribacillus iranensis]SFE99645.1 iron complex transport system substrate-binding protein [Alteribacillus iranensis]